MSVSLFQHLHEGLLITDAELRALDANPAYTQILGVPRDELLGTVPLLLRPAPADPVARQQRAAMWASLRDTGSWRGELLERRRNGEPCTLQTTISTVRGPGAGPALPRARHLRHHRTAPAARATRAPGALRRADAPAQPIAADAIARRRHARGRPRRLPARGVLPRPGPLQARQRPLRPRRRRPLAGRTGRPPAQRAAQPRAAGPTPRRAWAATNSCCCCAPARWKRRGWRWNVCCAWWRCLTSSTRRKTRCR